MRRSIRSWTALGGLIFVLASIQVAIGVRRGDWTEMLSLDGLLWSALPTIFMGAWGCIVLFVVGGARSAWVQRLLMGLAIVYFAYAGVTSYDIVANGNSTSGIAFFFIPFAASLVMLPLIALIVWIGVKVDGEGVD